MLCIVNCCVVGIAFFAQRYDCNLYPTVLYHSNYASLTLRPISVVFQGSGAEYMSGENIVYLLIRIL